MAFQEEETIACAKLTRMEPSAIERLVMDVIIGPMTLKRFF